MQRIGLNLEKHLHTSRFWCAENHLLKSCARQTQLLHKKFIFLFFRIIISLEKIPRKPVWILREEIGDFNLLKHIKLLVTDSTFQTRDFLNNFFSIYDDFGDLSENQKSHVLFELNEMRPSVNWKVRGEKVRGFVRPSDPPEGRLRASRLAAWERSPRHSANAVS